MPAPGYTPQEVAAVSGTVLAAVQKAITAGKIPARRDGRTRRRELDETAILAFALADAMPPELRLAPDAAYHLLKAAASTADPSGELAVGDAVRIDAKRMLEDVRRRLTLYKRARDLMVREPGIMGGTPVIRGTRITAQALLGRLEGGDTVEEILEDYPYLDREDVEAAALYARANPPRGRPAGRLWRSGS